MAIIEANMIPSYNYLASCCRGFRLAGDGELSLLSSIGDPKDDRVEPKDSLGVIIPGGPG